MLEHPEIERVNRTGYPQVTNSMSTMYQVPICDYCNERECNYRTSQGYICKQCKEED